MRWIAVLGLISGCDQVFGLAPRPDAAPAADADPTSDDARPAICPPIGTAPQFARVLHQVGTSYCWDYSISATTGLAMATCEAGVQIAEGPIDAELSQAGFGPGLDHPRLTPEGDEVIARRYNITPIYARYRKVGGTWTKQADTSFGFNVLFVSTPTRSPARRILVVDNTYVMHEMVDDGASGWTAHAMYTANDLGVTPGPIALTADGLRLVISPQTGAPEYVFWYADRASVNDRFGIATPLTSVSSSKFAAYLTEDCGRLYFTIGEAGAINTGVFYAPQL